MEIIHYTDNYFDRLVVFLKSNWALNHIIYNKEIFDWQYGGPIGDVTNSLIIIDKNQILGFLGCIPYSFLVDNEILAGIGFAIWVVDNSLINTGLGLLLRKEIESLYGITYVIGINDKVVNTYIKNKYIYSDGLIRYLVPLNLDGFKNLLQNDINDNELSYWVRSIHVTCPIVPNDSVNLNTLEKLYIKNIASCFLLAPYKQYSFWQWRYIESKGFKYLFFSSEGGIVIAHIENIHAPHLINIHKNKCFRFIEIIPACELIENFVFDQLLYNLIIGVLSWARDFGCTIADFQISNLRFDNILNKVGFKKQEKNNNINVARLFSPYRQEAKALNYAYRINSNTNLLLNNSDNTYFVKSDGDMDRPNWIT